MTFEQRCHFETERLAVGSWQHQVANPQSEQSFAKAVVDVLTPEVTKALPEGWQGIDSVDKAMKWMEDRAKESAFLTVQLLPSQDVVGFVFLYESMATDHWIDLRLGYLLSQSVWGQGLGSELIKGLVEWCEKAGDIQTISGGVEIENVGSIKVLEKNGFVISLQESQPEDTIFLERKFK